VLENYTLPVGAQAITFRYQFTGAVDGDYLVVSFGGHPPVGYGVDNAASESGEITAVLPVEHLAGQQGDLVFRVMSRGNPNAVAALKGITLGTVEDPDLDGLTNSQEAIHGTNPLLADSDGDGLTDPQEISSSLTGPLVGDSDGDGSNDGAEVAAGTNPLDGSSRFAVASPVKAGGDFTITWFSRPGRIYRVIRAAEPTFVSYVVVVSGIAAAPPQQSFVDSGAGSAVRMFYRVELEP
jgi:hypothetical protein